MMNARLSGMMFDENANSKIQLKLYINSFKCIYIYARKHFTKRYIIG